MIDNRIIDNVNSFTFLSITIDEHLNWKKHIEKTVNKCFKTNGIINKLMKHSLPTRIKLTLYNTLFQSHINYGIMVFCEFNNLNFIINSDIINCLHVKAFYLSKYRDRCTVLYHRIAMYILSSSSTLIFHISFARVFPPIYIYLYIYIQLYIYIYIYILLHM